MRAVVQRVSRASVAVGADTVGEIGKGILVLLGVSVRDTEKDTAYLVDKVLNLRIFDDTDGKMSLSLLDIEGELLVVSQFTLYGNATRGRRPSFTQAASPDLANRLYEAFITEAGKLVKVATGRFQAMMGVELVNDGPVTILLDNEKIF